jgi:hypothetical protein
MSEACVGRIGWSESLELGTDPRRVVFVLVVPVFVVVSALAVRTHEAEPLTMSREPLIEPPRSYREGKSEGKVQASCDTPSPACSPSAWCDPSWSALATTRQNIFSNTHPFTVQTTPLA